MGRPKQALPDVRTCNKCHVEQSIENFYWISKKNPEKGRAYRCKGCEAERSKANYQADPETRNKQNLARRMRNLELVQAKKAIPCTDCGIQYPPYVMDFDHLRDKSFNISMSLGRSPDLLLMEIEKCDVVCANCHRIRTHERRQK